jgi:hypothetical protein
MIEMAWNGISDRGFSGLMEAESKGGAPMRLSSQSKCQDLTPLLVSVTRLGRMTRRLKIEGKEGKIERTSPEFGTPQLTSACSSPKP